MDKTLVTSISTCQVSLKFSLSKYLCYHLRVGDTEPIVFGRRCRGVLDVAVHQAKELDIRRPGQQVVLQVRHKRQAQEWGSGATARDDTGGGRCHGGGRGSSGRTQEEGSSVHGRGRGQRSRSTALGRGIHSTLSKATFSTLFLSSADFCRSQLITIHNNTSDAKRPELTTFGFKFCNDILGVKKLFQQLMKIVF